MLSLPELFRSGYVIPQEEGLLVVHYTICIMICKDEPATDVLEQDWCPSEIYTVVCFSIVELIAQNQMVTFTSIESVGNAKSFVAKIKISNKALWCYKIRDTPGSLEGHHATGSNGQGIQDG